MYYLFVGSTMLLVYIQHDVFMLCWVGEIFNSALIRLFEFGNHSLFFTHA